MFECYINGKLNKNEIKPKHSKYYIEKYFKNAKSTLPNVVSEFAKKLAKEFRNAKVDKQNNVPFIGYIIFYLSMHWLIHIWMEKNNRKKKKKTMKENH